MNPLLPEVLHQCGHDVRLPRPGRQVEHQRHLRVVPVRESLDHGVEGPCVGFAQVEPLGDLRDQVPVVGEAGDHRLPSVWNGKRSLGMCTTREPRLALRAASIAPSSTTVEAMVRLSPPPTWEASSVTYSGVNGSRVT